MAEQTALLPPKRFSYITDIIFEKLLDAFLLYICMCLSEHLVSNILLGGALCLCGQVLITFIRLHSRRNNTLLPHAQQVRGFALLLASVLLFAILIFLYPAAATAQHFSLLIGVIMLLQVQYGATAVIAQRLRIRRFYRILVLLGIHTVMDAGILALLYPVLTPKQFSDNLTMLLAISIATLARQVMVIPRPRAVVKTDPNRLVHVSAYKIYNRMVSSAVAALNLALITYICTVRIENTSNMVTIFWDLIVWLVLVFGLSAIAFQFLRRGSLKQYDKPSVFVTGAVLFAVAILGTYREWFTGWGVLPGYLLWSIGLACMLAIILSMGYDMQAVLELDMKPEELTGYRYNTVAIVEWNLTLSTWLVLVLLTLLAFITEGHAETLVSLPAVQFVLSTLATWPVLFIIGALLFALMQPLNQDYAKKLAHYHTQQRRGNVNAMLETRLQMRLVKGSRRILPSILRAVIRPLMPCRVIGKQNVDTDHGPVVFVCNHLEIYGPLITNLHLPFYFRSWIIANMLDRNVVKEHLRPGVDIVFHWVPKRLRQKLPGLFAPILLKILQSLDPIPVYRGTMREVIKTIQLTVDAMEYEDNILLFPENPGEGSYQLQGVSQFYSGFATIGIEYYKRTGNCTTFYPMYVDKNKRTLTIGEGIRFSPKNSKSQEKERIVQALHTWMNAQH